MVKPVNQRLADEAIRHRLYLARYSTGQARKMQAALRRADIEITMRLLEALERQNLSISNYSIERLERLKRSIQGHVFDIYEQITGQLNADLLALVKGETAYQISTLTTIIPAVVVETVPIQAVGWSQVWAAANARPFQGMLLRGLADSLGEMLVKRIGDAVQQGIIQGLTHTQIIARVRGDKAANYDNGVMGISRRDLATITKTAVNHVAAEARDEVRKVNKDLIKARTWLSTLDTHTSKMCIVRDGLSYTADEKPKPIGHSVPYGAGPGRLHFCCRSTETWVIKSFEELGLNVKEAPEGTRASMDGQIPASVNYRDWLSTRDEGTLTRIVGVDRAQLIKEGKLKPSEMFNDKGEWLTLEQLRELDRIPSAG